MKESTFVRNAVEGPPDHDGLAMRSARGKLREAIERERAAATPGRREHKDRRHRSRAWWVAAAAVLAVVVLAAQALLPSGDLGPPRSAAAELLRLGSVAASRRSLEIAPGTYLYSKVLDESRYEKTDLGESPSFTMVVRTTTETWLAADGSGRRVRTVDQARFLSQQDEDAWRTAGSPAIPKAGTTTTENFSPKELSFYDVGSLPTDPTQLLAAIRSGQVVQAPENDAGLLGAIGKLLAQGNASPQLRQALFDLAARIASATLDPNAVDPLGKPGIGVTVTTDGITTELVLDPSTSVLSIEQHKGNGPIDWLAYSEQSLVDSLTARP
ncbi:MAG: CU044_5270 family protein [Actinomycetota bacterium]|nr:CU044_5270 family protein [Actinomycetota bacterium]